MLTLTKAITDWILWSRPSVDDEWITWEEWQRHQRPSHYEKSDLFQYYLTKRPQFQPPQNSCLNGYNQQYYVYCFGDFSALLVNPRGGGDIVQYINLLLDVYDVCKGFARKMVRGDPSSIAILRKVALTQNITPLTKYNFEPHCYPYNKIHAHTVAQYSLSSLLMRLVSHYLSKTGPKGCYPNILIPLCKQAYDEKVFGIPAIAGDSSVPSSPPITIPQPSKPKSDELRGFSWPMNPGKYLRCKSCNRVCENLWGNFEACIDCYFKRICSICGLAAVIITTDGLPKCCSHQQPTTS